MWLSIKLQCRHSLQSAQRLPFRHSISDIFKTVKGTWRVTVWLVTYIKRRYVHVVQSIGGIASQRLVCSISSCRQSVSNTNTTTVPSLLWRCWLGGRKGIRPVKKLAYPRKRQARAMISTKSIALTTFQWFGFDELWHDTWVRFSAIDLSSHTVLILLASHHRLVRELQFLIATTSKMSLWAVAAWMQLADDNMRWLGQFRETVTSSPIRSKAKWHQLKNHWIIHKQYVLLQRRIRFFLNGISKPWPK